MQQKRHECCNAAITGEALQHIHTRHQDLAEYLGASTPQELAQRLRAMLCSAEESYQDRYRENVTYCLKRESNYWINIVIVNGSVKTVYLINAKTYRRFREKRWR